jgi:hypothetical protein
MFNSLLEKIKKLHWGIISLGVLVILLGLSFLVNLIGNPPLTEFKGGIQNHLVWSNKGECYFVRPATNTVYLIRVEDCDKGNK